mgnify:CR=1 FL=1
MPSSESEAVVCAHRCPYCHTAAAPTRDAVACQRCLARHHGECWDESGRCSACGSAKPLRADALEVAPPAPEPPEPPAPPKRWRWTLVGMLLAVSPWLWGYLTRRVDVQRFLRKRAAAGWVVSQIDWGRSHELGPARRTQDELALGAPRRLYDGVWMVVVAEGEVPDQSGFPELRPDGSIVDHLHTCPGTWLVPRGSLVVLTDGGDCWLLQRGG